MTGFTFSKSFKAGEIVFREGDQGDCAYLIEQGRIKIQLDSGGEDTTVAILGAGDIFGEMAIIDTSARSATAKALDDCELIIVSKEQLNERIEQSDPIVRFLIGMLMNRIRKSLRFRDQEIEEKASQTNNVTNADNVTSIDAHRLLKDLKVLDSTKVVDKIKFEKELQRAMNNNEFAMHYQPILDFRDGEIAGFEALIRWYSKEFGLVRPDIFMGIAEETSLIIPLGQWIIDRSMQEFAELKKVAQAKKPLFLSINIAGKQFKDITLLSHLNESCDKYGLTPQEIKLEITERVLIEGNNVFNWIQRCRDQGFSVALDDFGTGFSSLSYLANLEVNGIKVDKSFVQKIVNDKKSKHIVKSIVRMGKALRMSVIAEGVETQEEWDILKRMGCTHMQGFFFSKPLPSTEIMSEIYSVKKKKAA